MKLEHIRVNERKALSVAYRDPRSHKFVRRVYTNWKRAALLEFNRRQRLDNEWRTSETTPPKYVNSFELSKGVRKWHFKNTDPGALLVEFGALAGGNTRVLGYSPMRKALDSLKE